MVCLQGGSVHRGLPPWNVYLRGWSASSGEVLGSSGGHYSGQYVTYWNVYLLNELYLSLISLFNYICNNLYFSNFCENGTLFKLLWKTGITRVGR